MLLAPLMPLPNVPKLRALLVGSVEIELFGREKKARLSDSTTGRVHDTRTAVRMGSILGGMMILFDDGEQSDGSSCASFVGIKGDEFTITRGRNSLLAKFWNWRQEGGVCVPTCYLHLYLYLYLCLYRTHGLPPRATAREPCFRFVTYGRFYALRYNT